jgi:hypothetical protein
MERILVGEAVTSEAIAEAVEVVVANYQLPTELNALGDASGQDWAMTYQLTGGSLDPATLYRLQPTAGAEDMPYVVDSAIGGYQWVAIAGRYIANHLDVAGSINADTTVVAQDDITSNQQVRSRNDAGAIIQLDHNAATGLFSGSLSPANLTANRRWTFPDADLTISGSAAALTAGRIPFVAAGGVLTDSSALTYSATVLNIANTTAANTSTNGSLTIGNGTVATNVGIGGGSIYAGDKVVAGRGDTAFITIESGGVFTRLINNSGAMAFYTGGGATSMLVLSSTTSSMASTTAASSSITGALVIGDGATAATNVGIGGGNIHAGGSVYGTGSAASVVAPAFGLPNNRIISWRDAAAGYTNSGFLYFDTSNDLHLGARNATKLSLSNTTSTFATDVTASGRIGARGTAQGAFGVLTATETAPDSISAWTTTQHSLLAGNLASSTGSALGASFNYTTGAVSLIALAPTVAWLPFFLHADSYQFRTSGSTTAKLGITAAGVVSITNTTAASSSIAGAVIIGDQSTAATNVAIGGGSIFTGSDINVGVQNGLRRIILAGANSGAGNGSTMAIRNATTDIVLIGNKSAILGSAYDATPYVYTGSAGTTTIEFSAGIKVNSTTLLTTGVALTNGAGASAGTISNAPSVGNPTKWIPINDNGTTRYVPAW